MQHAKSTLGDKLKVRWKLMLLALPFTAVGLGFLLLSVLPTLMDARQMQHWQQGQAQLISAGVKVNRGDDSTTYKAFATYRYRFAGRDYTGSRVAIGSSADNIGDFQQQLGRQLERAQRESRTVNVYINPDNPAQAVLNRELRWELLLFKLVFVLVFGGVGLGILLYALLAPLDTLKTVDARDKPWLTRRDWASPEIKCNGKVLLWGSLGFAVFWNLIAIPVGIKCVMEFTEGNTAALIGLLFPLVGLGLVIWAVNKWRAYKRFGPAPLQMDPYPGSIGGQVGGVIEVKVPYDNSVGFVTKLGCFEVYYTRSGKERRRHEKLVWQSEGFATTRATGISANKTRLQILFNVSDNLPESQAPSNRYHLWRLTVKADLPGADFNRSYELPVFATATQATHITALSSDNPLQHQFSEKAIESVLEVRQIPGGVELDNPAFRRPGGKLIGILISAVFTGVSVVMWQQKAPLLFTLIVFLIGTLAALYCAYSLVVRLQARLDSSALHIRKSLLGIGAGSRKIDRSDITGLAIKESYVAATGHNHRVFYQVQVVTRENKKITIVRNLEGRPTAEQALESLSLLTGVPHNDG